MSTENGIPKYESNPWSVGRKPGVEPKCHCSSNTSSSNISSSTRH